MPAYMIFIREGEIADPEAMDRYLKGKLPGEPEAGKKVLAAYGALETVEGEAADGIVIIEFPDRESAQAWYFSDEYQHRARERRAAASYRAFIVDGR